MIGSPEFFPSSEEFVSWRGDSPSWWWDSWNAHGGTWKQDWVWVPGEILSVPLIQLPLPSQTTRIAIPGPSSLPQALRFRVAQRSRQWLLRPMLQPTGRAGPDFSRTSQLIMVSHSVKQGELRQFTPSLLSRSFKASSSCEGHFHPSCCKPTNVIIESHWFHATRFLPATKVAEGRNWGAGGGGGECVVPAPSAWLSQVPPPPPGQAPEAFPALSPQLALCFPALCHPLSLLLENVHPQRQRPCSLALSPVPSRREFSKWQQLSHTVTSPRALSGPAALYHLPSPTGRWRSPEQCLA